MSAQDGRREGNHGRDRTVHEMVVSALNSSAIFGMAVTTMVPSKPARKTERHMPTKTRMKEHLEITGSTPACTGVGVTVFASDSTAAALAIFADAQAKCNGLGCNHRKATGRKKNTSAHCMMLLSSAVNENAQTPRARPISEQTTSS